MRRLEILLSFLLLYTFCYPIAPIGNTYEYNHITNFSSQSSLEEADDFYQKGDYSKALNSYTLALKTATADSAYVLKKIALSHAALGDSKAAAKNIEAYLLKDFNTSVLVHDGFSSVSTSEVFQQIVEKYNPRINLWSLVYLYIALIGFYIAVLINFNKNIEVVARILISIFIFIHSFFIFHICLSITNYQYQFPHSYLMSTSFSFLYGPLLYLYFKRITQEYQLRKVDLLHLLPTLIFMVYLTPIYFMSGNDKLALMLDRAQSEYNSGEFLQIIVTLKLTSLIVYGYFIRKLYIRSKKTNELSSRNRVWQRNIYFIHFAYVFSYAIYGILITNQITFGFFYHAQIISMSLMVLYVGYSANVQPKVFSGLFSYENQLFLKYKKSGLTDSLSKELRNQLLYLFNEEKIYKENNISLELLAQKLNTTRHNTSQVINEHFNISFHELVNRYRIEEAKKLLDNDHQKNLNIIDIAYEVGYNNKVTFNKAFKKDTQLTPSEYQKIYIRS